MRGTISGDHLDKNTFKNADLSACWRPSLQWWWFIINRRGVFDYIHFSLFWEATNYQLRNCENSFARRAMLIEPQRKTREDPVARRSVGNTLTMTKNCQRQNGHSATLVSVVPLLLLVSLASMRCGDTMVIWSPHWQWFWSLERSQAEPQQTGDLRTGCNKNPRYANPGRQRAMPSGNAWWQQWSNGGQYFNAWRNTIWLFSHCMIKIVCTLVLVTYEHNREPSKVVECCGERVESAQIGVGAQAWIVFLLAIFIGLFYWSFSLA